jgi:hypothetical protein
MRGQRTTTPLPVPRERDTRGSSLTAFEEASREVLEPLVVVVVVAVQAARVKTMEITAGMNIGNGLPPWIRGGRIDRERGKSTDNLAVKPPDMCFPECTPREARPRPPVSEASYPSKLADVDRLAIDSRSR